ncbi:IS200/IS605 family transposase [Mesobacillus foraminis]|uniref:Putative transposase n=1 Tax=Mesobacillus foraminis TaxID=279826 RepID=A0A4R2AZC7_9BACI|nr:IS200/IS605 family transposase [Mesobacillus foraminis]TCN18442.1 putative transposase [Mesobacillus foraminis]
MSVIQTNKYHVSSLQYHIVFFTANDITLNDIEIDFVMKYFTSVSRRHEFKILKMEVLARFAYLVINCKTTHYIPNMMKALKGGSARFMYKEFPDSRNKNGDSLWDSKYFISSDQCQLEKLIQNYGYNNLFELQ